MTVGEKIKEARLKKGLTQQELADLLGYKSRSSINKIEVGGRDIPRSQIVQIAKTLGVAPAYLMGWAQYGTQLWKARLHFGLEIEELSARTGISTEALKKFEQDDSEPSDEELALIAAAYGVDLGVLLWSSFETAPISNASLLPSDKIRMIPIYESVSAGFGAYADNYITGYTPCYIVNDEDARNTLCITVQGDSMYPKIENGDLVQVLRQDWAENGQIAVVLLDGENGLVKKYEQDDQSITLVSINPEYPPKVFKGVERTRLRVLGVVKKIIKEV